MRDRPRRRHRPHAGALALAVGAIAAGGLWGCGGDGDETASSPTTTSTAVQGTASGRADAGGSRDGGKQGQLLTAKLHARLAIEAVLTSSNPADACGRFVTRHYLQVAFGSRQGCLQAQAPGSAARKLDAKDLRIDANRAAVVVVPSGGPYDGERLTVSLVRQGRRWAVDELHANVPVGP